MRRRLLALMAVLALGAALLDVPPAHAVVGQLTSCTSGVAWTMKAAWGNRYRAADGQQRTQLRVSWKAMAGTVDTDWAVTSINSDGGTAGIRTAREKVNYKNGTASRVYDPLDPAGERPKVRISVGVHGHPATDCVVDFTAPSQLSPPSQPTQSSKILFEDDFNGPRGALPNQAKWRDYSGCTSARMAFGKITCGNNETLTGDGKLTIPATPTAGSGLTTAGRYAFTYGIASAWIKTPKTTGYWPAFWTENRPQDFHSVPLYGEADILELYTFEPQYAHTGLMHAWGRNGQVWSGSKDNHCTAPGVKNWGDGYHKYTMTFEPGRLTGYIDDVQCGITIVKSSDPAKPWPLPPDVNLPNYLILDLAIGGAGGRNPTPPRADVMLVDRVEVRSLG